jgi:hypothetical protein
MRTQKEVESALAKIIKRKEQAEAKKRFRYAAGLLDCEVALKWVLGRINVPYVKGDGE